MSLGTKIRVKRAEKDMKQGELAKKIGVTQQYLRLIEKDEADPRISLLRKIADELEISISTLIEN